MTDLERINHRLYRAGQRLHDLREEVRDFIECGDAYDYRKDEEPGDSVRTFEIRAQPVPDDIIKLTGEIASELWGALCDLGSLLSGEGVADFPVTDSPEEFTAWVDAFLPNIGDEERAAIEATQRYETADFFGVIRRIATRHQNGELTGRVAITGGMQRSRTMTEAGADSTKAPRVAHVIAPDHPWAHKTFNVHMHVGLVVEVLVGTPVHVTDQLEGAHSDARALLNALDLGRDGG
jgi:hypothetical protein